MDDPNWEFRLDERREGRFGDEEKRGEEETGWRIGEAGEDWKGFGETREIEREPRGEELDRGEVGVDWMGWGSGEKRGTSEGEMGETREG